MRVTLALFVVVAVAAAAQPGVRPRARTIRGFKNVALSTARGFGKRDPSALAPDPLRSFPLEWFVAELQSNADLARLVVHKFVDANHDGELTADELLRPLDLF